jgi:hypothetical protein
MITMNRHLERRWMGFSAVLFGLAAGLVFASAAQASPATQVASLSTAPNLGTPEGTAALVKEASSLGLGAGEFHLGMPADAAIAKLKSLGYFANQAPDDGVFSFAMNEIPDQEFVGGAAGFLGDTTERVTTVVGLNFTMYPNPPVVSAITRSVTYPDSQAPTIGNTLAALRKKYGPESKMVEDTLFWFYDHQGQRLSKAAVEQMQHRCAQIDASHAPEPIGLRGHVADRITKGLAGNVSPACLDVVYVSASVAGRDVASGQPVYFDHGWDAVANGLMTRLLVNIYDMPLEYSASTVSRNLILHNDAAKKQKAIDAAKQRPVSDL